MSIPAETPAAVITAPVSTKRSSGRTSISRPSVGSSSSDCQWVVAGLPSSSPAAASTSEPVQTLATTVPPPASPRTQSSTASSFSSVRVPRPPGYTSTSKGGAVSHVSSGSTRRPFAHLTTPSERASVKTRTPSSGHCSAQAASTSQGPAQSSSSAPSKSATPIVVATRRLYAFGSRLRLDRIAGTLSDGMRNCTRRAVTLTVLAAGLAAVAGASTAPRAPAASARPLVARAHVFAPGANILLVETPVSETEGVHGFPQMIKAENYVIKHHLASVISQSFGATENTFKTRKSLFALRSAFKLAAKSGVTVLAASGDTGSTDYKLNGADLYPFRVNSWPSSDPLVTSVGGTQLNLDDAGSRLLPDVVWNDRSGAGGGGLSHIFARPTYQSAVSVIVGSHRGTPDVSLSAAVDGRG